MASPIFLLSDFGLRDAFVGAMRAVLARDAPGAPVHDVLHTLPPQDLDAARLQLAAVVPYLPDGAVLVAVVDPGVGTDRGGLALRVARADGARLWAVAPDNGLLSGLLETQRSPYGTPARAEAAWSLVRAALPPAGPGTTFDGRDLFAPAAARLARGDAPEGLGPPLDVAAAVRRPPPALRRDRHGWHGRVAWIDRFGNLVSDVPAAELPAAGWTLTVAGRRLAGPAVGFGAVAAGAPLAYVGSLGTVEVALRDGDAAGAWGVALGAPIEVEPR
jgi:hypothetical protein